MLTRREAISIGAGLGLTLPDLFRLQAAHAGGTRSSFGSAKSVIFIFLHGGHPQHETWDPKPQAPAEVRGEFGDTATAIPGYRVSELLPECSKIVDRFSIVRSMAHGNTNHVQACLPAMTGHKHPPSVKSRGDFPPSETDFPHYGAVLDHLRHEHSPLRVTRSDTQSASLPTWVQLGPVMTRSNRTVLHGQSPGFLGRRHSPLTVDRDFLAADVEDEAITPRVGVERLKDRQSLLGELQSQRRTLDHAGVHVKDAFYERAYNLLTSDVIHKAFDLSSESPAVRAKYPQNQVGQSCLLARRLVEAGVPFVNVHWCKTPSKSWDTHGQNFKKMKESLGPTLDQSLSALVLDLEERGLLDQTLVMPMAEFGRTPKINKNAGRDHWPFVYTLAMAGAGLKRGVVHGQSDRLGAYPQSAPYDPADMAATIYHLLGIPSDTTLYDQQRRPHQLVVGKPIEAILS